MKGKRGAKLQLEILYLVLASEASTASAGGALK